MWNPLGQIVQPGALGAYAPQTTSAPQTNPGGRVRSARGQRDPFSFLGLGLGPMGGTADPNSFQAAMQAHRAAMPGMPMPFGGQNLLQSGALAGFLGGGAGGGGIPADWQQQMQAWQDAMQAHRAARPLRADF